MAATVRADPLVLKLTSGSTHRPKAVVANEAHLDRGRRHIIEAMEIRPDDIGLGTFRCRTPTASARCCCVLLQGTSIALRDGFSAESLAADVAACAATYMPGVPFIYDYLRRHGSGA